MIRQELSDYRDRLNNERRDLMMKLLPKRQRVVKVKTKSTPEEIARTRLGNIRGALAYLDTRGWRRSAQQRKFHEAFLRACVRAIFKDCFEEVEDYICEQNDWENVSRQEVLIVTPRRFGKTTSVALYCAAYVCCVPKCEIGIFSTCLRAR